jgi:hypothetical protein
MIDIGFIGNGNTHVQFATSMEEKSYAFRVLRREDGSNIPHLRLEWVGVVNFLSLLGLPGWCCCAGQARDFCLIRMMIHTVWNESFLYLARYVARCRHDIQWIEICTMSISFNTYDISYNNDVAVDM